MANTKDLLAMIKAKKQDIAQKSGGRQKTVKPPAGKSRWRILPSWRGGDDQFWHDFGQHFIKDSTGAIKAVYVCVEKTYGPERACDVCLSLGRLATTVSDQATLDLLGEAKSSNRILVNANRIQGTAEDKEVVILELTPTTFGKYLSLLEDPEYNDILDSNVGRDITIEREGTGINTKYTVSPSAKQTKVDPAILGKLNNLDDYVAQEYEEGKRKVMAAVGYMAGDLQASNPNLLAAPTPQPDDADNIPFAGGTVINATATVVPNPNPNPAPAPQPAPAQATSQPVQAAPAAPAATPAPAPTVATTKMATEEIAAGQVAGQFDDDEIAKLLADLG